MRHGDNPRARRGVDPRTQQHLRKIAPEGRRGQIDQIRRLRTKWRTNDLLVVLNWDLPSMTDDAIHESVEQARYRPTGIIEVVEALSRFAGIPAPPDSIYRVPVVKFVLGPVVFTHHLAIKVAQSIIANKPRPRLRHAASHATTMGLEWIRHREAGFDAESDGAFQHGLKVCHAATDRLTELPAQPAQWADRLRQCPGCQTFFWNAHVRSDAKPECSDACRKKVKRRSPAPE